jgi:hypothetical protein
MVRFIEISFQNIKAEVERYLTSKHNKSSISYSPASPYGQLLDVIERMFANGMFYLKSSINSLNILGRNSNIESNILTTAILNGYNPFRAISSTGTLKLKVKTGIDLESELRGLKFTLRDKSLLRNKTNGLFYSIKLSTESITYNVQNGQEFFIEIIQGQYKEVNLTGTGEKNQTFQVQALRGEEIENFNIDVRVNGEIWNVKKHIYELSNKEKACVVRTGISGGLDIIFGNGSFGDIPPLSSLIEVKYLITNGADGNIFRRTPDDFIFVDSPTDGFGNGINISNIFDVIIFNDINFGANRESITFIKNLLPFSSNNFILALPEQYAFAIKKLGVFSHVNALEDEGIIYIIATPNIRLFKRKNANYFSVSRDAFILDDYEKEKIVKYLKMGGNIQLTKKFRIDSPKLSEYIMNVFYIKDPDFSDDKIKSDILERTSEYFLNLDKLDRIPKSDLISIISEIEGIKSVDVQFISRKNEDYHKQFSGTNNMDYNDLDTPGLDPILGDIIFTPDEYPIIRGGWYDRNGIYFSDNVENNNSLKSINIIKNN